MSSYDRLGALPLTIGDVELTQRYTETASGFERTTTVITFEGDGHRGRGEDVCYATEAHEALAETGLDLPLDTIETVDDLHRAIDPASFRFGIDDPSEVSRNYRRWAIESAGLDLALRQRGVSLAAALDRTYEPVRFVTSPRLGDPPSAERVLELCDTVDRIGFKLDPTPDWDEVLIEQLRATEAVHILDLKGLYEDPDVGQPADAEGYARLLEAFPEAVFEDPAVTPDTRPVLAEATQQLSWDYPIRSVDDIDTRPWPPAYLNIKPSRFGSIKQLLATIELAQERGIRLYGGGQFELDVGREHLHVIASLWYPDGPNDIAPTEYHAPDDIRSLPSTPLEPPSAPVGLSWR